MDACRLMVLQAAEAMDVLENRKARIYVSASKANVLKKIWRLVDVAIRMDGATGVTQ